MMIKLKNNRNIASVSWSDHLVFGEDDGRLLTPGASSKSKNDCKSFALPIDL